MADLGDIFPNAETLLALAPEELGDVLLEVIHTSRFTAGKFGVHEILAGTYQADETSWPQGLRRQVAKAVMEAIDWLQYSGFLMYDPEETNFQWRILTRRGHQLKTREQSAQYRDAAILPKGLVHREIWAKCSAAFLRGDHNIAVFSAFKIIETAVRKVGSFEDGQIGVKLMRKAFEPGSGALADKSLENGEQQAQCELFSGAIGAAKNPTSHRDVEMSRIEAAWLILFASYLLSIVDSRVELGTK